MMQQLKLNKVPLSDELHSILIPLKAWIEEGKFITKDEVKLLLDNSLKEREFFPIVNKHLKLMIDIF